MSLKRVRLNNLSTQKVSGRSLRLSRLSRKRFPFPSAASIIANYIEDVFSTYLYTGNGSTQTITNGIDLSGKGGILWTKNRQSGYEAQIYSSAVGVDKYLVPSTTASTASSLSGLAFNTNGFTLNSNDNSNASGQTGVSWTFRKQAKFFDVVTYTGNGASGARAIAHNLGSTPGCYIVKRTDGISFWPVYHRMMNGGTNPHNYWVALESTSSQVLNTAYFGAAPTSTNFYVADNINANGASYVAYLFAHDAGGFGAAGTDNVISCGSYTSNGSTISVNLGWEPQWILIKRSSNTGNWCVTDNMRGMTAATVNASAPLFPNLSDAELAASSTNGPAINATGFTVPYSSSAFNYPSGETYIYIAIRRGPMRTPTSGTSVFSPNLETTSASAQTLTTNFPVDLTISTQRNKSMEASTYAIDRLRGTQYAAGCKQLSTNSTAAEYSWTSSVGFGYDNNTGIKDGYWPNVIGNPYDIVLWNFRRAPGFFDVVAYTATGSNGLIVNHNLGVVPELTILKSRTGTRNWEINFDFTSTQCKRLQFTTTNAVTGDYGTSGISHYAKPTTTQLSLTGSTNAPNTNTNTENIIGYLFASCPGVSKFGSYTGTGTTLQIDCGFTAGARFVMIKCTDSDNSPQNWYVWDSARGIVGGDDPYLFLNSTAAEVTNTDYIDSYSAGFEISSTAPIQINALNGTYIFLAIA